MEQPSALPSTGSVDVLFVAYGGGHIAMVLPVAKAAQALGQRVCIFALTTAIPVARASGLPWFSYDALLQSHNLTSCALGAKLAVNMPRNSAVSAAETRAYLGCNMAELCETHGLDRAMTMYRESGRNAFFPINTMKEVFTSVQPRVVVATNSPRTEKAAITAAKEVGIPALCLVDMFALQTVEWLKASDYADRVCVLNDQVRDLFLSKGRPAEHVVVTGNPAFDALVQPATRAAGRELRRKKGWEKNACVVLYASAPETDVHVTTGEPSDPLLPRKIESALRAITAQDPSLTLVIRRHPSENQKVKKGERITQSLTNEPLDPLLHAVDVVAVSCSTVGFQGHLAGRQVLSVECSAVSPNVPYGAMGISTAVDDVEGIPAGLAVCRDRLLAQETADQATVRLATDRVVDQIFSLLVRTV